jgi:hypothetical protein
MAMKHSVWAREQSRAHGAARTVIFALASAADDAKNECYPSITTLARWTGLHRTNVIRAIAELEELQEIVCERSKGRGTVYTLTLREPVAVRYQSDSQTSSAPLPVANRYQSRSATKLVAHRYQTSSAPLPIKVFKDQEREKHDLIPDLAVDVDGETPKQKTPETPPVDAAIKRQSHTWVEPAAADAGKIWADICAQLRMELPPATCDQYFHNLTAGSLAHGVLELVAPYEYQAEFINGRLGHVTARAARSVSGDVAAVRCVSKQRQDDPGYASVATLLGVKT